MILGFKKQFVDPIRNGTKIHTIREDSSDRWKAGNHIHFATGVRTKNYECFGELKCISIQTIEINYSDHAEQPFIAIDGWTKYDCLFTTTKERNWLDNFVKNDGFDSIESFCNWFNKDFKGKIIHWTNLKY